MKNRIGLYEKALPDALAFKEKLALAKAAGYDYFELSIDETDRKLTRLDMSAQERLSMLKSMYEIGIHVETICLSGHRKYPMGSNDNATRARSIEMTEKAVILARDIGARIIQLAGYDVYYEPSTDDTKKYFLENLKKSVDIAAAYGVVLAFETMETPFMNTVAKAMEYVKKINSPYLLVYPDIGNITSGALDALTDLEIGRGHIAAAHLKETKPGVFRNLQFGDGHVDFNRVIPKLSDLGVNRFTLEFWHDGKTEPLKYIKKSRDFFRGLL